MIPNQTSVVVKPPSIKATRIGAAGGTVKSPGKVGGVTVKMPTPRTAA